jgi:hypothetical protein
MASVPAKIAKAIAPAVAALNVAVPAVFAEGTGEVSGCGFRSIFNRNEQIVDSSRHVGYSVRVARQKFRQMSGSITQQCDSWLPR